MKAVSVNLQMGRGFTAIELNFFRGTEMIVTLSRATTILADKPCIFQELFIVIQIRLDIPDIMQIAKVLLMSRVWHFVVSHVSILLFNNFNTPSNWNLVNYRRSNQSIPRKSEDQVSLPSFAKVPDSPRGMAGEGGTFRISLRSVVGYASEDSAPKQVNKPPAPAGGASHLLHENAFVGLF